MIIEPQQFVDVPGQGAESPAPAPTLIRPTLIRIDEGRANVTPLVAGGVLTGADAHLFRYDAATGMLDFVYAPDFEAPTDTDRDGRYEVAVDEQAFLVEVANVNEAPRITSEGGRDVAFESIILENTTTLTTVVAGDPDGNRIRYSISGGADATAFLIDPDTGVLRFAVAPDYEAHADADRDNRYEVVVTASDGELSDTQALSCRILDDQDVRISSGGGGWRASLSVAEGVSFVTQVAATEIESGRQIRYSIYGGADAHLFSIHPRYGWLNFLGTFDYEVPKDADPQRSV